MEAEQWHGEGAADGTHGHADPTVALAPHGFQFGPAGGDIDSEQRGEIEPMRGLPAVRQQIRLQVAGRHVDPFGEGAQRDLGAQGRETRAGRRQAVAPVQPADGPQEPIDGGRADLQEGGALLRRELHLVMALQGSEQRRQKGRQALGAEMVTEFPYLLQGGPQCTRIPRGASRPPARALRPVPQQRNGDLPMPRRDPTKFIQEATLVAT